MDQWFSWTQSCLKTQGLSSTVHQRHHSTTTWLQFSYQAWHLVRWCSRAYELMCFRLVQSHRNTNGFPILWRSLLLFQPWRTSLCQWKRKEKSLCQLITCSNISPCSTGTYTYKREKLQGVAVKRNRTPYVAIAAMAKIPFFRHVPHETFW